MSPSTLFRISVDVIRGNGVRERYWTAREHARRLALLRQPRHVAFADEVKRSHKRFLSGLVTPVVDETRERARAAVEWILRAQDATPDDGVSVGYFPCEGSDKPAWRSSYPETTGYIIVSLLEYAERFGDTGVRDRALRMAHWEASVQMPSGAVQSGPVCPLERQAPAVFNTGMVLQGFVAVLQRVLDARVLTAARRAADFLVADMGPDGHFRTHGQHVTPDRVKTYNCLCAWPLYRFGEHTGDDKYQKAALRAVDAALGERRANGWFANNCLTRPEAPLLHTIGYTLQGLLEVGILAKSERLIEAVRSPALRLLGSIRADGFIAGRFYENWEPACFSACLTGSAQLSIVYYRLFELFGDQRFREAADRLINFLKALQRLDSADPNVNGAIAGSFPILGDYMTGGYPNWATKYFLDALMLQDRLANA